MSELKTASKELNDIIDELRDVHGDPVAMTDEMVIFADKHGYELSEIVEYHNDKHDANITRDELSNWMHYKARSVYGREEAKGTGDPWAVADPIVVLRE